MAFEKEYNKLFFKTMGWLVCLIGFLVFVICLISQPNSIKKEFLKIKNQKVKT